MFQENFLYWHLIYRVSKKRIMKHIKLFEQYFIADFIGTDSEKVIGKNKEIAAGFSYKWEGEDLSDAESGFYQVTDAVGYVAKLIEEARLEDYGRGLAWIVVIPKGGEIPEPEFETGRGEILLEGSYEPIIIMDVANEYSEYGGQYTRNGEIYSKVMAITELSQFWGSRY